LRVLGVLRLKGGVLVLKVAGELGPLGAFLAVTVVQDGLLLRAPLSRHAALLVPEQVDELVPDLPARLLRFGQLVELERDFLPIVVSMLGLDFSQQLLFLSERKVTSRVQVFLIYLMI